MIKRLFILLCLFVLCGCSKVEEPSIDSNVTEKPVSIVGKVTLQNASVQQLYFTRGYGQAIEDLTTHMAMGRNMATARSLLIVQYNQEIDKSKKLMDRLDSLLGIPNIGSRHPYVKK